MKEQISGRQATYTTIAVLLGTVFLPIGQIMASEAGRDGWMAVIPGCFITFPFVYLTLYVFLQGQGTDMFQQIKNLLGRWLAYPLILIFSAVTAWFGGLLLRQGGELFGRNIMTHTPFPIFTIGELLLVIFVVYGGLEVFARFNEVVIVPIVLSLLILMGFSIPKMELGYLKPYFYNGFSPILKGYGGVLPFGLEYTLFLWVLLPSINKPHELIRSTLRGYTIVTILLTGITITMFGVFSPEETVRLFYGSLSLARMAEGGKLFHGLEAFFIMFWFGASIIKTTAYFFCAYRSLQAIIPFRHSLVSVGLFSLVILIISFIPPNGIELLEMITTADKYLITPLAFGIVLLTAVATYFQKRVLKK